MACGTRSHPGWADARGGMVEEDPDKDPVQHDLREHSSKRGCWKQFVQEQGNRHCEGRTEPLCGRSRGSANSCGMKYMDDDVSI